MKSKNRMKKSSKGRMTWIVVLVLIMGAAAAIVFSPQPASVAKIINEQGSHPSVSSAFNACNVARAESVSDGQNCEECALVAYQGRVDEQANGKYTYNYGTASSIYSGEYTDLEVDYINGQKTTISDHESNNPSYYKTTLLEVKSYCNDQIRLCERQIGSGDVVSTENVDHGKIQKIKYTSGLTNCDTDEVVVYTSVKYQYKLICDSGYFSDLYFSKHKDELTCVSVEAGREAAENQGGAITSYNVPERVSVGQEMNIRYVFKADAAGRYLLSGQVGTDDQIVALSVVEGFSASNPCGGTAGLQKAAKYLDLEAGDQAIIDLAVKAPTDAGDYKVQLLVSNQCGNSVVYDYDELVIEVQDVVTYQDETIEQIITDEPEFYENYLKELIEGFDDELERVAEEGCSNEDLTVNGCKIAYCDEAGEVQMYENVVCEDGNVIDQQDLTSGLVAQDQTFGQKLFSFKEGGYGYYGVIIIAVVLLSLALLLINRRGGRRR